MQWHLEQMDSLADASGAGNRCLPPLCWKSPGLRSDRPGLGLGPSLNQSRGPETSHSHRQKGMGWVVAKGSSPPEGEALCKPKWEWGRRGRWFVSSPRELDSPCNALKDCSSSYLACEKMGFCWSAKQFMFPSLCFLFSPACVALRKPTRIISSFTIQLIWNTHISLKVCTRENKGKNDQELIWRYNYGGFHCTSWFRAI